jgi:CubicO group peptidase (beta-lactamase class C family)
MNHVRWIAGLVAIVLSFGAHGPVRAQQRSSAAADIDAFVAQMMATGWMPGLAVGVVQGNTAVYAKGFGFADRERRRSVTADTQFYIASTTKSLTALAAAALAQRKTIDLEQSLTQALPGVAFHAGISPDAITLRDLLTHTHGIKPGGPVDLRTAYTGDFTNQQLLRLLRLHAPAPTGRAFAYSNLGYNIFSLALDTRFPEGWKSVLDREVFRPLGMTSTTALMSKADRNRLALPYEYRIARPERVDYAKADSNMQAGGGHISSVNDLTRFLVAQLNDGRIDNRQALPRGVIASTHQKFADQNRAFGVFQRFGWSLGWDMATYENDTILQRFGDFQGFRSHVSFMPERRMGVVVLSNGGGVSSPLTDLVATYIYDRLLEKPALAARYAERMNDLRQQFDRIMKDAAQRLTRPQTTPLPLSAYVGTYESEALGGMVWTFEDGRLVVRLGIAKGDVEVYDGTKYQLRTTLTGAGSVATFVVPAGASQPTAVEWMEETFVRAAP